MFWKASGDVVNRSSSAFLWCRARNVKMKPVDAPPPIFRHDFSIQHWISFFFSLAAGVCIHPGKGKKGNIRGENKSQECGPSEREKGEEPGKWGCKSGRQTYYKFITDFPRRATLLRIQAKSPTQNLLHSRAVPAKKKEKERDGGIGGGRWCYVSGAISYLSLLKKIVMAFELFGQYPSRTIKNLS